jgi:hypothetical protein
VHYSHGVWWYCEVVRFIKINLNEPIPVMKVNLCVRVCVTFLLKMI